MTLAERWWNLSSYLNLAIAPILRETFENNEQGRTLVMGNCRRICGAWSSSGKESRENTKAGFVSQRPSQAHALAQNEQTKPDPSRPRSSAPAWPQAATSPVINVEQLTDQVLRQIDRRFVAYRERMGKPF
jgi:hypothetical protein